MKTILPFDGQIQYIEDENPQDNSYAISVLTVIAILILIPLAIWLN